jgi:hypothetical protein
MSTISQDTSSAGMAAAIEANLNATFSLLGRSPNTQLHDDDPDLCWYITPRACYALGRKSHRNADSTIGLVTSRSPFPAFLSRF